MQLFLSIRRKHKFILVPTAFYMNTLRKERAIWIMDRFSVCLFIFSSTTWHLTCVVKILERALYLLSQKFYLQRSLGFSAKESYEQM